MPKAKKQEEPIVNKTVQSGFSVEPAHKAPILIPLDENTVTRSKPTLELKDIVGKLRVGTAYRIKKTVTSVVYGDFYQLENNLYITKVGNYSVKE